MSLYPPSVDAPSAAVISSSSTASALVPPLLSASLRNIVTAAEVAVKTPGSAAEYSHPYVPRGCSGSTKCETASYGQVSQLTFSSNTGLSFSRPEACHRTAPLLTECIANVSVTRPQSSRLPSPYRRCSPLEVSGCHLSTLPGNRNGLAESECYFACDSTASPASSSLSSGGQAVTPPTSVYSSQVTRPVVCCLLDALRSRKLSKKDPHSVKDRWSLTASVPGDNTTRTTHHMSSASRYSNSVDDASNLVASHLVSNDDGEKQLCARYCRTTRSSDSSSLESSSPLYSTTSEEDSENQECQKQLFDSAINTRTSQYSPYSLQYAQPDCADSHQAKRRFAASSGSKYTGGLVSTLSLSTTSPSNMLLSTMPIPRLVGDSAWKKQNTDYVPTVEPFGSNDRIRPLEVYQCRSASGWLSASPNNPNNKEERMEKETGYSHSCFPRLPFPTDGYENPTLSIFSLAKHSGPASHDSVLPYAHEWEKSTLENIQSPSSVEAPLAYVAQSGSSSERSASYNVCNVGKLIPALGVGTSTTVATHNRIFEDRYCSRMKATVLRKVTEPLRQDMVDAAEHQQPGQTKGGSASGIKRNSVIYCSCEKTSEASIAAAARVAALEVVPTEPHTLSSTDQFGPVALSHARLYGVEGGAVAFPEPPLGGYRYSRGELRGWPVREEEVISQNSSKRKVHRGLWLSSAAPGAAFPAAVKFVEDENARDGRSIKREIECHLYIQQRLEQLRKEEGVTRAEDAWPSAELFGYHLDKHHPGRCVLVTRKLSGPDLFDVIRQEHHHHHHHQHRNDYRTTTAFGTSAYSSSSPTCVGHLAYEYHKLHWCTLALKRVQQYARLGIRHNDVKPDNIVLDFYVTASGHRALDVKIIDLGTASMHSAKDFTGGTSWYESPEQKVLEYHSKKQRNPEAARRVDIGLASDVWAAGLSIAEVLVGRRVVDALRFGGPNPLEYRGPDQGWAVEPTEWVQRVRQALLLSPSLGASTVEPASPVSQQKPLTGPQIDNATPSTAQQTVASISDTCDNTVTSVTSCHSGLSSPAAVTFPFCFEAAQYVFDHLVRPVPAERGSLQQAIDKLVSQACKALEHSRNMAVTLK